MTRLRLSEDECLLAYQQINKQINKLPSTHTRAVPNIHCKAIVSHHCRGTQGPPNTVHNFLPGHPKRVINGPLTVSRQCVHHSRKALFKDSHLAIIYDLVICIDHIAFITSVCVCVIQPFNHALISLAGVFPSSSDVCSIVYLSASVCSLISVRVLCPSPISAKLSLFADYS